MKSKLIQEKRRAFETGDYRVIENNNQVVKHIKSNYKKEDEDIPTRKIFIDHVLCNETKFTDAEVRDHVYTIVAAGSETTALQTAHTSKEINHVSEKKFLLFIFFYFSSL
jgi:cytochrome P450